MKLIDEIKTFAVEEKKKRKKIKNPVNKTKISKAVNEANKILKDKGIE